MKPVLFELGGVPVSSYGASKALAILAAIWILARELRRVDLSPDLAYPLVLAGAAGGFLGAKLYYLAEHADSLTLHSFGGSGFTWYGGLIGGALAVLAVIAHKRLPVAAIAGVAGIPLAVAYAIGRIGCFLAGDGTYGVASDLPWAMSFPDGTVPTTERVHPTALYEAAGAFLIAALLWRLRGRIAPVRLFGLYVILSGLARALVEIVRRNDTVLGGLTQPQLWSLALVALGVVLLLRGDDLRSARPPRRPATGTAGTAG